MTYRFLCLPTSVAIFEAFKLDCVRVHAVLPSILKIVVSG